MIHDTWYMVHDTWYMIHDTWYMIHDTWYMIHDTWYMIHDDIYCWTFLIFMLMLDLWPQAETPGVTHFGAYHRPLDGYFFIHWRLWNWSIFFLNANTDGQILLQNHHVNFKRQLYGKLLLKGCIEFNDQRAGIFNTLMNRNQ